MGAVSRAIAESQYHLASARALAAGQPKPARRPACFFDPRPGMSVRDVLWAASDGGPAREVPACYDCARKVERGIEPELRRVEVQGQRVPSGSRYPRARCAGSGPPRPPRAAHPVTISLGKQQSPALQPDVRLFFRAGQQDGADSWDGLRTGFGEQGGGGLLAVFPSAGHPRRDQSGHDGCGE